jgi:hypothetical protein
VGGSGEPSPKYRLGPQSLTLLGQALGQQGSIGGPGWVRVGVPLVWVGQVGWVWVGGSGAPSPGGCLGPTFGPCWSRCWASRVLQVGQGEWVMFHLLLQQSTCWLHLAEQPATQVTNTTTWSCMANIQPQHGHVRPTTPACVYTPLALSGLLDALLTLDPKAKPSQ